jgi:hypothetical protein
MNSKPQKEHEWLQKLVGEWIYENESTMAPGNPPVKLAGTESVRSLGSLWILCEGHGEMPDGGKATMIITLGYDPIKKRYVGTFIGSMMTNMWIYEAELNQEANTLTLNTEGPSFTDEKKIAKYKDIIEIKNDDHRLLSSCYLDDDGKWQNFMTATYRRVV